MKHAEESATKAEPQGDGALGLVDDRRVVQPKLVERGPELRVIVVLEGVEAGEDHRLDRLIAWERGGSRLYGARHRVTDADVAHILEAGGDVADFAALQAVKWL